MKAYIFTEAERIALLHELQLEKFFTPDQFQVTPEARAAQKAAVEGMHHRFYYVVSKFFGKE